MDRTKIVTGVDDSEKQGFARQLRREMTPAERSLWNRLRRNALDGHHFRRQQVIDGFIVDFYCHAVGLVVEVDGPIHEACAEQDAQRDAALEARGLQVMRFANHRVLNDAEQVLSEILAAIRERLVF